MKHTAGGGMVFRKSLGTLCVVCQHRGKWSPVHKLYVHSYSASKSFNILKILYSLLIVCAPSRGEIEGHKAMIWVSKWHNYDYSVLEHVINVRNLITSFCLKKSLYCYFFFFHNVLQISVQLQNFIGPSRIDKKMKSNLKRQKTYRGWRKHGQRMRNWVF